jgi:hypothetical protein
MTEIQQCGKETAQAHIRKAVATMVRLDKVRAPFFKELLSKARREKARPDAEREIVRNPGNPMLRHNADAEANSGAAAIQEKLPL